MMALEADSASLVYNTQAESRQLLPRADSVKTLILFKFGFSTSLYSIANLPKKFILIYKNYKYSPLNTRACSFMVVDSPRTSIITNVQNTVTCHYNPLDEYMFCLTSALEEPSGLL